MNFAKDYVKDIKQKIVRNDIDFYSPNKYEIHFANGYFDLKNFTMKKRNPDNHFISVYINRVFDIPEIKYIDEIEELTSQIMANQDDKNYIFKTFGASLTGDVVDDQTNLILLGK